MFEDLQVNALSIANISTCNQLQTSQEKKLYNFKCSLNLPGTNLFPNEKNSNKFKLVVFFIPENHRISNVFRGHENIGQWHKMN